MARYLFTTWSFPGHLHPLFAIADALRARGHDVAFYTGARAQGQLAERNLPHFPMRHVDEDAVYAAIFPPDGGAGRSSLSQVPRLRAALRAWMLDTISGQLTDLEPVLDTWQPDAVVCDYTIWAPFLVLHETRSLPVAMVSLATGCMLSGPDAPPWGRALPPPKTHTRRLRYALERRVIGWVNRDFPATASRIRARYGLPPLAESIVDYAARMPLYLVASVPELDYNRHDLPPAVSYIGALDAPMENATPPAWLARVPAGQPLVYVTEGTLGRARPLLLSAAAHGLSGLDAFVLLKDARALEPRDALAALGLDSLPSNMALEGYIPGQGWRADVLARAAVVVTTAGAGSVAAALSAGVPMVVVPTEWDKAENARRVVAAGAGLQVSERDCTPQHLRAAVERIVREPSFRANATRLAAAFGRFDGPERAAELIMGMQPSDTTVKVSNLAAR